LHDIEIALPADQPVVQDRTIYGEVVDPAKKAIEKAALEEWHRSISGGKRK